MSNPAVIILDSESNKYGKFKRFVIEDNIGEAIHLHIDNLRFDFKINEFIEFASLVRESLNELNIFKGYNVSDFDENFLKNCKKHLKNLNNIKIEKIKISDVKCIHRIHLKKGLYLTKVVRVEETTAYKYLKGTSDSFVSYPQSNYINDTNIKRLSELKLSINLGYPMGSKYIILFNGQNIVMDGQHRIAVLADTYGLDAEIEIMRFYFTGTKHYYNHKISNAYKILYWAAKKIYYRYIKK